MAGPTSEAGPRGVDLAMAIDVRLRDAADQQRAKAMSAYMKHQFDFLGLPKPERARLARPELVAARRLDVSEVMAMVDALWAGRERELKYLAIDTAQANVQRLGAGDFERIVAMIDSDPWWDTVDALRKVISTWLLGHRDQLEARAAQLLAGSMWRRRVAITAQLQWRDGTDRAVLDDAIARNASDPEFFIQKAIGWALRDYARTNPSWVIAACDRHGLTGLARREALKRTRGQAVTAAAEGP